MARETRERKLTMGILEMLRRQGAPQMDDLQLERPRETGPAEPPEDETADEYLDRVPKVVSPSRMRSAERLHAGKKRREEWLRARRAGERMPE